MRRLFVLLTLAALAGFAVTQAPPDRTATAQTAPAYEATFPGTPASPQPFTGDASLRVQAHQREMWSDPNQWPAMTADHGSDCTGHPATHQVAAGDVAHAAFLCNDHLMTAINAPTYGIVYLTPDVMADFGAGETVIRFDLSTLRTSLRDWVDVWITPYADYLSQPLDQTWPDLQGEPRNGVHVLMSNTSTGETRWAVSVIRNGVVTWLPEVNPYAGQESFLTPSAVRRDTYELRLSASHVTFSMPEYGRKWVDTAISPALGWTSGIVQFGHHSYSPEKDCTSTTRLRSPRDIASMRRDPVAFTAMTHGPSLNGVDIDVGVGRGVLMSPRTMRDGSATVLSNPRATREVTPLAVDLMRDSFQMGRVHANAVTAQMIDVVPSGAFFTMSEDIRYTGSGGPVAHEGNVAIAGGRSGPKVWPATIDSGRRINLAPKAFFRQAIGVSMLRLHQKLTPSGVTPWAVDAAPGHLLFSSILTQSADQCSPSTWHWDNLTISQGTPFMQVPANERIVSANNFQPPVATFTFSEPAPQDALCRFTYFGANSEASNVTTPEYSLDGGTTWQTATRAWQPVNAESHFGSFEFPVPAGTDDVQIRGQGGFWGSQWSVKDVALMAQGRGNATPTPTRTPTPAPTATRTPTPTPTRTPTPLPPTPTATATATPTPTVTPSVTVTPTATATPCNARGNSGKCH